MNLTTSLLIALSITGFIWLIFYVYDLKFSHSQTKSKIYESPFKNRTIEDTRVKISVGNHTANTDTIIGKTNSVDYNNILEEEISTPLPITDNTSNFMTIISDGNDEIESNDLYGDSAKDFAGEDFLNAVDFESESFEIEENEVDTVLRDFETELNYEETDYFQFRKREENEVFSDEY